MSNNASKMPAKSKAASHASGCNFMTMGNNLSERTMCASMGHIATQGAGMAEYAGSTLTTPWADVERDADGLIAKSFVNPLSLMVGDETFHRALVIPVNVLSPTQVTSDATKGRPGCWWIGKGVGYCSL